MKAAVEVRRASAYAAGETEIRWGVVAGSVVIGVG
jgi:hypothetical protein